MPFQTDPSWTPRAYRIALDAWRDNAPANDGDIIPIARSAAKPRHGAMARELSPLRTLMSPPSGEPISTNWRASAANDNRAPEDFAAETAREILPSLTALERIIEGVEGVGGIKCTYRPEPQMLAGGRLEARRAGREIHGRPFGLDVENGEYEDDAKKRHRTIVRLGELHFSDGVQTEKAYRRAIDGGLQQYDARLPVGAMLFTSEAITRTKGGASPAKETNGYVAAVLGADPICHLPGSRTKRTGPGRNYPNPPLPPRSMPLAEARAFAGLPPMKKSMKPVLPAGSASLSGLFLSIRSGSSGKGTLESWQENYHGRLAADEWRRTYASLTERSRTVLEAALSAATFTDVGRAAGHSGEYARKAGKVELIAANDDLREALGISAA